MSLFRRKKHCHGCYFFDMGESDIGIDVFWGDCRLLGREIHDSLKEFCDFYRKPTPFQAYIKCPLCGEFKAPEVRKIRDEKWKLIIDIARCSSCITLLDVAAKRAHPTDAWRDK